jgi:hypothetical protein
VRCGWREHAKRGEDHGQSTLEPVFDDTTRNVAFIMTPFKAPLKANPAWKRFWLRWHG